MPSFKQIPAGKKEALVSFLTGHKAEQGYKFRANGYQSYWMFLIHIPAITGFWIRMVIRQLNLHGGHFLPLI